jgi:hypothetical protein
MVLGNINEEHSLYRYLLKNGADEKRLKWFVENPARIDVIGLDYYSHSELEWNKKVAFIRIFSRKVSFRWRWITSTVSICR